MMKTLICVALESEMPREKLDGEPILYTGVGKINATISLMARLHDYPEIQRVINVGSAGGIKGRVKRGEVCQFTLFREDLSFPTHEEEIIEYGEGGLIISTFDRFQTKEPLWVTDAVDMESYALAKVCKLMGKEFLCYKFISDLIGDTNQEKVWEDEHKNGQQLLLDVINKL